MASTKRIGQFCRPEAKKDSIRWLGSRRIVGNEVQNSRADRFPANRDQMLRQATRRLRVLPSAHPSNAEIAVLSSITKSEEVD